MYCNRVLCYKPKQRVLVHKVDSILRKNLEYGWNITIANEPHLTDLCASLLIYKKRR